jgi:hypothetical protein
MDDAHDDLLCALGARTAPRARLSRLQRKEINRQAHLAAQQFEHAERERLTREALDKIIKTRS